MIIAEDSDTIPYGCAEIIFKLDRGGACQHLVFSNILKNPSPAFDLVGFDEEQIVLLCVGAGCDYLVMNVIICLLI